MEQKRLADSWHELHELMSKSMIATPEDLIRVGSKLLEVLSLLSNEKVRLVAKLKTQPQTDGVQFAKRVHGMVVKGMAYEERKALSELALPKEIWDAKRRLEVVDTMVESCRQFLFTLKTISSALDLDAKLSFEGHE